jgi:hypothetical protein
VPDGVSDEAAAFTVVGAIALQGIRLAGPTLGESFAVVGLGLVGLMTVQLLRGSGCRVLGIDTDPARIKLARTLGAEVVDISDGGDPVAHAMSFSGGRGVDGVLFTASTKSSEPMHQAAEMCRKRGRIVLVGVAGLELRRSDFFEKELTFQVSCSYGPGRYDPLYEESGQDYPFGFVRWTERRNFEAVLDMLASGRLDVESLVSHRFPVVRALDAYGLLGSGEPSLGIVLDYTSVGESSDEAVLERTVRIGERGDSARPPAGRGAVGFVGSGNYATAVLIPAFKSAGAELVSVASRGGLSSKTGVSTPWSWPRDTTATPPWSARRSRLASMSSSRNRWQSRAKSWTRSNPSTSVWSPGRSSWSVSTGASRLTSGRSRPFSPSFQDPGHS